MQLTKNFQLKEFYVSDSYPKIAEAMCDRPYTTKNLLFLCESILQPLRSEFGVMKVLSGYRDEMLNQKVGGSKDSDHMYGIAADVEMATAISEQVFMWCINKNMPYRQMILYKEKDFIHFSVNIPGRSYKRQAMIFDGNEYNIIKEGI